MNELKWKTILGLVVLWVGVLLNWNWVWGVLFILWTLPALYSGRTYFVEEIDRDDHPVLFWMLVGTWILLSVYLIYIDVAALL